MKRTSSRMERDCEPPPKECEPPPERPGRTQPWNDRRDITLFASWQRKAPKRKRNHELFIRMVRRNGESILQRTGLICKFLENSDEEDGCIDIIRGHNQWDRELTGMSLPWQRLIRDHRVLHVAVFEFPFALVEESELIPESLAKIWFQQLVQQSGDNLSWASTLPSAQQVLQCMLQGEAKRALMEITRNAYYWDDYNDEERRTLAQQAAIHCDSALDYIPDELQTLELQLMALGPFPLQLYNASRVLADADTRPPAVIQCIETMAASIDLKNFQQKSQGMQIRHCWFKWKGWQDIEDPVGRITKCFAVIEDTYVNLPSHVCRLYDEMAPLLSTLHLVMSLLNMSSLYHREEQCLKLVKKCFDETHLQKSKMLMYLRQYSYTSTFNRAKRMAISC
jgi:hypothetical protein